MTRDDITLMADASGLSFYGMGKDRGKFLHYLEAFAALVAAAEREACAKVCDVRCVEDGWEGGYADECAAEIRARSKS
jgi:hypothetical protein